MRTAIVAGGLAVLLAGCDRGAAPLAGKEYKVWVFTYGAGCEVQTGVELLTVPDGSVIAWELSAGANTSGCGGTVLEVGPFKASDGTDCDVTDQPGGTDRKKIKKAKKRGANPEMCKYTVKVGSKAQDPELEMY